MRASVGENIDIPFDQIDRFVFPKQPTALQRGLYGLPNTHENFKPGVVQKTRDVCFMAIYLITGIAGFIGSSLARAALAQGIEVRGIDNFSTGKRENIADIQHDIDFREADLLNLEAVQDACRNVDCVFHEAAIPSVPKSVSDPLGSNRVNLDGTVHLLIAARNAKVRRVVYAASSSAYGSTPILPKEETMSPDPISPYAVAKLAGEYYMTSFHRCYGLETICLRYFNIFGPRQDPTSPYSGVLAKFITQMLDGEQPIIFGDGTQTRDYTYIDNTVEANLLAAKAPASRVAGQIFNVATGIGVDLNKTFQLLKAMTGFKGDPKYGPERIGDVKHSVANLCLTESSLGYRPKVSFEEGLRRTVEWYRSKQPSPRVDLPETYISGATPGLLEEVKTTNFNLPAGR